MSAPWGQRGLRATRTGSPRAGPAGKFPFPLWGNAGYRRVFSVQSLGRLTDALPGAGERHRVRGNGRGGGGSVRFGSVRRGWRPPARASPARRAAALRRPLPAPPGAAAAADWEPVPPPRPAAPGPGGSRPGCPAGSRWAAGEGRPREGFNAASPQPPREGGVPSLRRLPPPLPNRVT